MERIWKKITQTWLGFSPVEGTSTFTWTPNGMNSGVVTWSNDMSEDIFPSSQIRAQIWVVETTAKFEEGTNGLEDYNKIVETSSNSRILERVKWISQMLLM